MSKRQHEVEVPESEMINDKRAIGILELFDNSAVTLGENGVSAIEAYGEPGLHCDMPWIKVIDTKGAVMARMPATMCMITYVDMEATMADHKDERPN